MPTHGKFALGVGATVQASKSNSGYPAPLPAAFASPPSRSSPPCEAPTSILQQNPLASPYECSSCYPRSCSDTKNDRTLNGSFQKMNTIAEMNNYPGIRETWTLPRASTHTKIREGKKSMPFTQSPHSSNILCSPLTQHYACPNCYDQALAHKSLSHRYSTIQFTT